MAENRESINCLIAHLNDLRQKLANVTTTIITEYQELEGFLLKYLQLLAICAPNQSYVNVAARTCECTAGHAVHGTPIPEYKNPRATKEGTVVDTLHLRLLADPTQQLWKYYSVI